MRVAVVASAGCHVLSLVPNGRLRLGAVGLQHWPAKSAELAEMTARLEESLEQAQSGTGHTRR